MKNIIKFLKVAIVAIPLLVVGSAYAAESDYTIKNYVTSKSTYVNPIRTDRNINVPLGAVEVNMGQRVKLKILVAAGLNYAALVPMSNTFQYGVFLGNSEANLSTSNGGVIELYSDNLKKSTEHYAYVYVDNSAGTKTFFMMNSSVLTIFALNDANAYDTWCGTSCTASGTVTVSTPSTSTPTLSGGGTNTGTVNNSSVSFLDLIAGAGASSTPTTTPSTKTPLASQTYIAGQNGVFEYLLIKALENAGIEISKVTDLNIINNVFSFPIDDIKTFKGSINFSDIPAAIDDIDEKSVQFYAAGVDGMDEKNIAGIQFEYKGSNRNLPFYPVNNDDRIISLLEQYEGVFKVVRSDDGWMVIILDNGQAISLFLDNIVKFVLDEPATEQLYFDRPVDHGYQTDDVNGDGINDVIFLFDGMAQLMLLKPVE